MKEPIQNKINQISFWLKSFLYFSIITYTFLSFITVYSKTATTDPGYDPDTVFLFGTQSYGYGSTNNNIYDPYNWHVHMPYVKDSLRMNLLSFWRNENSYVAGDYDGGLYNDLSGYQSNVNNYIDYMSANSLTGVYERGTISKLCLAQRSTYQVEDSLYYGFLNNVSPSTGQNFSNDSYGVSGRKCISGTHTAGYIVSGLIENQEQSDNWKYAGAGPEDDTLWYVKPRMRVDSIDAINHLNDTICKIEIYSFNETKVKSIRITGANFISPTSGTYNGKYIEEFFFQTLLDTNLSIMGDSSHLNKGAHTSFDSTFNFEDSKVDYRIWWTGVCNLWVDYVRLDDRFANELFKPNTTLNPNRFVNKLKAETQTFGNNAYAYYVDEIRYNNLPAMKYIQKLIRDSTTTTARISALYFPSIYNGLRRSTTLGIKRQIKQGTAYLDSLLPQFVMSDIYTFNTGSRDASENQKCYFPPNLSAVNFPTLDYLRASSFSQYNTSLQRALGDKTSNYDVTDNLFTFSFIPGINKLSKEAKSKGIKHIPVIQAHAFLTVRTNTDSVALGLREPTVEEINVLAYLSIIHGAGGIMLEAYQTPDTALGQD